MKRMILVSLFSLNLITAIAYAQQSSKPVNLEQNTRQSTSSVQQEAVNRDALIPQRVTTVAAAKNLTDNTQVLLQGQVIRALGKEKYEFRDASGTMIVEIDNQQWQGKPITQHARVSLIGEIDRESDNKVELDVDEVRSVSARR